MATYALTPVSFDATSINDATYDSRFVQADNVGAPPDLEPVEVEIPGSYPVSPRAQPASRVLPLSVRLLSSEQSALNAFKKLFDSDKGECVLKAQDGDGNDWRLNVQVLGAPQRTEVLTTWVVRLYAPRPIWESDSEHSDPETGINTSPYTWNPSPAPAGTKRAYPAIIITPTAQKTQANGYQYRRQVIIAWRSELEGVSSDGLGYPVDVNEGGLDLSAEQTAGRLQVDGDDLRVLVDGEEANRWIDTSLVADYVWANVTYTRKRRAVLKSAMTAGNPANGAWFDCSIASAPIGTFEFASLTDFYITIDNECLHVVDHDATRFKLSSTDGRGARNTTAASHSASADIYWVEHDIQLVYGYSAAADPPASADRQPIIDLANSTNLVHKYPGPFTAPTTLRSGQLLRKYTADNLLSPAISLIEEGGGIKFRDVAPSADAPRFNNLELYVPCGVKAAAGAITHDVTVEDILALEVYGVDLEGFETLLERYNSGNDGAAKTLTPAAVLSRLRYAANAVILTGADTDDADGETVGLTEKAQQFTLDQSSEIWALLLRLKKTTAPDGNVEVRIRADANGVPGTRIGPEFTLAASGLATSYADYIFRWSSLAGAYIVLPAGTYWLAVNRSLDTGGSVEWSFSPSQLYAKGIFYGAEASGSSPEGPNSPDTGADDPAVGTVAWSNPGNILASDDARAIATPTSLGQRTHYLKATDFDFVIPDDAEIQGIVVEFERSGVTVGADATIADWLVYLVSGGTPIGENKASPIKWSGTEAYYTYGGPTDLWGREWTPAEINAVDFGVALAVQNVFANINAAANVDHIRITVYFGASQRQTAHFAILSRPQATLQAEAPSGSGHESLLDDIEITFDDDTPRTPKIVVAGQESIYWLKGTLKNDDTGQEIELDIVLPLNESLTIDCEAHTVVRSDTGDRAPSAITPTDVEEWMRFEPGTVNLRYTEAGIGTVSVTVSWRDSWA